MTGASVSRIEPPQPPPIDRRGGSAIAFGVLRADAANEGAPLLEPEQGLDDAAEDAVDADPAVEEFPTGRT